MPPWMHLSTQEIIHFHLDYPPSDGVVFSLRALTVVIFDFRPSLSTPVIYVPYMYCCL